jgi:hypothetical protein
MSRYNHDSFSRIYQIGGADLALRYAEMASNTTERSNNDDYKLRVIDLSFFNGGFNAPPISDCRFALRFSQTNAQFIYYKLDLVNPWKHTSYNYLITARYYKPDNTLMCELKNEVKTIPEWQTFWHSDGWGWDEAGHWIPGTYRVEILADGEFLASDSFTIFQEAVKKPLGDWKPFGIDDLLSTPRDRTHPVSFLPENLTNGSVSQQPTNKIEDPSPQGIGFAGWMDRINKLFPTDSPPDKKVPTDDMGKLRWLADVDRRYMEATVQARPGMADPKVVRDLEEIAEDYQSLIDAPISKAPLYTKASLQSKLAGTYCIMAQADEALHDYELARQHYETAIKIYRELGEKDRVQFCRTGLDHLDFAQYGNVDKKIVHLHKALSKVSINSVEHADLLIELGGIYRQNGDDFEAEKVLLQAEEVLESIGGERSGGDIADALTDSLLDIFSGNDKGGPKDINTVMKIDGLYRVLSVELSRIYEVSDPVKASHYRAKAAQRDSRATNDAFSQKMLSSLSDLFKDR